MQRIKWKITKLNNCPLLSEYQVPAEGKLYECKEHPDCAVSLAVACIWYHCCDTVPWSSVPWITALLSAIPNNILPDYRQIHRPRETWTGVRRKRSEINRNGYDVSGFLVMLRERKYEVVFDRSIDICSREIWPKKMIPPFWMIMLCNCLFIWPGCVVVNERMKLPRDLKDKC